MTHRTAGIAATLLAGLAVHTASAQPLYQARYPTYACASDRATIALTRNDPRMSDSGWVNYVMGNGQCVQVTPNSQWAMVHPSGSLVLLRNVVPGSGAEFYFSRTAMIALGGPPPPSQPAASGRVEKWDPYDHATIAILGRVTFSPTRITFEGGKSLPLQAEGTMPFATDTGDHVTAQVFRVTRPTAFTPASGNGVCGAATPVTYVLVWRAKLDNAKEPRGLALFTGQTVSTSSGYCGSFTFDAAG
jgi:hypothetical protein